jgi:uncharacterized membrane protein
MSKAILLTHAIVISAFIAVAVLILRHPEVAAHLPLPASLAGGTMSLILQVLILLSFAMIVILTVIIIMCEIATHALRWYARRQGRNALKQEASS